MQGLIIRATGAGGNACATIVPADIQDSDVTIVQTKGISTC